MERRGVKRRSEEESRPRRGKAHCVGEEAGVGACMCGRFWRGRAHAAERGEARDPDARRLAGDELHNVVLHGARVCGNATMASLSPVTRCPSVAPRGVVSANLRV